VSEIEMMAEQADVADNWSAGQKKFFQVLDDFDADTTAGARLFAALASHGQTSILSALNGWAEQQENRLRVIQTALPLPASARLDSTLGLLDRVVARTSALDHRSDCTTITSGTRDDLGLLPSKDLCAPIPVDGTSSVVPLPDISGAPAGSPPNVIMPPGLLGSPPVNPGPVSGKVGQRGQPGLPGAPDTGDVLPAPGQPGAAPSQPLPGSGSPSPAVPLPLPGIPLPLLPPA
jgi:hypothetical protein